MKAAILSNREFAPSYFHLALSCPASTKDFRPGQFAMIGFGGLDPFLPRAFSIYRGAKGKGQTTKLEFLYKVMGKGSAVLARMRPGDTLELLAPLGNGFTVPADLRTAILVAGGIGVPPMAALARWISHQPRLAAFIGGRSKEDALCVEDFKQAGAEVHIATEDGSLGHRGMITELLEEFLRATTYPLPAVVYACGPHAMLHAVARVAESYHLPCQVSMEAAMACGFGACMGCAIRVKPSAVSHQPSASYKLCCKEGPVFQAEEVVW